MKRNVVLVMVGMLVGMILLAIIPFRHVNPERRDIHYAACMEYLPESYIRY